MRSHLAVTLLVACLAAPAAAVEVDLVYTGPADSPALQGLRLGIDESNRQGEFLDVKLNLSQSSGGALPASAIAVFADSPGSIRSIAGKAGERAVFNLSDGADALRAACLPNALHVIPSAKMRADAVAQWVQRNPAGKPSAAAWHGHAVKFAARDLNKRFAAQFGTRMDDLAWAGWFAARAVGDTLMREPSADARRLLELLKQADGFDGQKGDAHSFRDSGQLSQPLVLVGPDGELLGEAPVRGVSTGLDSLGAFPCK